MTGRRALTADLRRQRLLPGLVLVWLFAFQTVLGGLALARTLPAQQWAALAGHALCLPGDGEPVPAGHEHRDCTLCLPNGSAGPLALGTGPAALPARNTLAPIPRLVWPLAESPVRQPDTRSAAARAPPRA